MKTYKTVKRQVEDTVRCDLCDHNCTIDTFGSEYATLEAVWGYSSNKDGTKYDIHLCEQCFDKTIDWMKHTRKKLLACFSYPHDTDPLNGKTYKLL